MHDLQKLGEALSRLDPRLLAPLALPERLTDALAVARSATRHEARRRQLQYVGRLMREVDAEPIRAALAELDAVPRAERARFATAERWRDRLLAEDAALAEFTLAHPHAEPAALAALVRDAREERDRRTPPRRSRELFRAIRAALEAARTAEAPSPPEPRR